MIFYDMIFTASQNLIDNIFREGDSTTLLYKINAYLDKECANKSFVAQAYEVKDNLLRFACCFNCATMKQQNISQTLVEYLQELSNACIVIQTIEEITTSEFYQMIKTAEEQSLYKKESANGETSWAEDFNPDVLASAHYETEEYIFSQKATPSKIMSEAQVHYKITATSFEKAKEIVEDIVSNSMLTNRIIGTRTIFVKLKVPRINNSFEKEVADFFERASGTTVIIDLASICFRKNVPNFARDLSRELWDAFEKNILKYADQISFVFLETGEVSPESKEVLDRLTDKLKIVNIG